MSRTTLLVDVPFSATHQIFIGGELEPVHGHDFRCVAEVGCSDDRDAEFLRPAIAAAIAALSHTHLIAVERSQGGRASAERIAAHLFEDLGRRLDQGLTVERVTVHESPGCSASYRG